MNGLKMPTKLLLLCICFLLPLVWSQKENVCKTYNENFTCDATPTKTPISFWLPQNHEYMETMETPKTCGNNTMETTLKLFKEGTSIIDTEYTKLNGKDEAVLMVGNTGTGKSTLTYFVAGNDSAIISTLTRIGEYRVKDCNGRIGDSLVVSRTTFPEAVVDSNTSTAFFDYPGFFDTRDLPCVELANAYFMLDVAQRLKRAKIIFVIEYSVITGNKGAFFSTLKSVIDFIPNIEKLGPGIGLMATKYDKEKVDHSIVVEFVIAFLDIVLADQELDQTFKNPVELRKAKFLIAALKDSTRIGIFRTPNNCGPLSTIDLMIENKKDLQNVMLKNVNFVNVQPSDFGYSLSPDIKLEISYMRSNLSVAITASLTTVKNVVSNFLTYDCNDQVQCNQVYNTIKTLYNDKDFTNKYANFNSWSGHSIEIIVKNTTAVYFKILGSKLSSEVLKDLLTNSEYLDILESLDHAPVNLAGLYLPLQNLQTNISSSVKTFSSNLNSKIELILESVSTSMYNKIFTSEVCDNNTCKKLLSDITNLYSNSDFSDNYLYPGKWAGMSYENTIIRLINITGFTPSEALQSYSRNLDDILKLESGLTVNVDNWLKHLRGLKTKIDIAVKTHFKNAVYTLIKNTTSVLYETVLENKKFAELDDIFSVKDQITGLTRTTLNYKVAMEFEFLNGNLDAKIFLEKAIANFKGLGLANAESAFYAKFDPTSFFKFFETNKFSIKLDKSEKASWLESLVNFEVSVSYESVWYKFLVDLFGDLSHQNTQIDNVWKFKDWYNKFSEFDPATYATEFVTFWDTFSSVPTIAGQHLTEITNLLSNSDDWMPKIDSLNRLLTTTLTDTLKCIYDVNILKCTGVFVSMKKVLSYQDLPDNAFANAHTLVIKALHTFFLDDILTGNNFNHNNNLDVYIISPKWVTSEGSINLDGHVGSSPPPKGGIGGADGSPGGVGSNAGNLYGIVGTSPMTYPTITATGGNGGNGQVGQDGSMGLIGKTNEVSSDSSIIWKSHCTASTGQVSLTSVICSKSCTCFDAKDTSKTGYSSCHAGDNGAWFNVEGDDGTNGYKGGNGGQPGKGGLGGYVYLKNVADSTNRDKTGLQGSQGLEGRGAKGGEGGRNGNVYDIRIDDVGGSRSETRLNKRCVIRENGKSTLQPKLQPGSYGVDGQSSLSAADPIPHTFNYKTLVPNYIKEFKAAADVYQTNKFLKAPLSEFQAKVAQLTV